MSYHMPGYAPIGPLQQTVPLECPECGNEWDRELYFELGGWFMQHDEAGYCYHCNVRGVERGILYGY